MRRYDYISDADLQYYRGHVMKKRRVRPVTPRMLPRARPRATIIPSPAPPGGYVLIYPFDVLRNTGQLTWQQRYGQKRRALRFFGDLFPVDGCHRHAWVTITRVMGPRQRRLDGDNLQLGTKGLRDALKAGGYIQDDAPQYATIRYGEDSSRRTQGPYIEIVIAYQGEMPDA